MKSKKLIIFSHCILNQNAVVNGSGRDKSNYPIVEAVLRKKISIIQLPCTEILDSGINRLSKTQTEYDTKEYRKPCEELLIFYINQIEMYITNGYSILALIGIEGSPSCALTKKEVFL